MIFKIFKRIMDTLLSFIGLIVLSPIFILVIILIKLDSKGPILFKQKRVGKNKKHFYIYKFRTMRIDTPKDTPTHLLENPEQWITKMGKFMRRTSIDELPQIINILKGDMSIIGPRPALWNQFDLIDERDKYGANDVYPGLTGYAQIHGRDELSIAQKAKLDGYYVKHMSLWLDIKIFFGTFFSIFKSEGVVEGGTGTIDKNKDQK
ncbi:Putative colanic biosynthesis UDP-glucose lipid carrier transferase [Acholeplasma oculi]|uniref:UDP-phosphate galactose phosphotransferase n=1 Tax=Acholeplasma oculi TaxID=35623 RepID=A0A061A9B5_9MOLU|nr:sugar transferase [Acholeplasma oculi]CDR30485.1 UDP-phosphate galactose phosphotransferase [Acholeplasma oculi]SKC48097.1 O-antigen biosynthesis protein WbqP [Acholeplasma oculi]SUT89111.1 Putative colanic biosynthesis UDP-glucose lipid carrier transferase [Acholeplasma oculi]